MFRIATWNVNSLRVRLAHVTAWLETSEPEVLAIQETKTIDENFPVSEFEQMGYYSTYAGQKTYNGVAILSKKPANLVAKEFPDFVDPQRRILCVTIDDICILNLYVPNGSEVGSEKYAYKLEWLSHLQSFTESILQKYQRCIITGDFNIAPTDEDVHDPEAWAGKVLCSEPEREAFFKLTGQGLEDCFRLFERGEKIFSWWDYRAAGFRRNRGLRIDHILASRPLAARCTACEIDVAPRKLERPSDHAPVYCDFDI